MIPALFVFVYLGIVLYIGSLRSGPRLGARKRKSFLSPAGRWGLTFFAVVVWHEHDGVFDPGSSGHAFNNGIVTYGLMASSSAFIIPLSLFFIGTRVWALGKKYGFMTPVQMFRDRWECGHIGTVIFAVQAIFLAPIS
jgi:Na+/proline symporter